MAKWDISLEAYWSREELLRFTAAWRESPALLGLLVEDISRRVGAVKKPDEEVRVGRVWVSNTSTQMGIHLERGNRVGACVTLTWRNTKPNICSVRVGALSRNQVKLVWAALGVGIAGGILLSMAIPGAGKEPGLFFLLGLLGGVALGVGLMFAIVRGGLGGSRSESLELLARVERALELLR